MLLLRIIYNIRIGNLIIKEKELQPHLFRKLCWKLIKKNIRRRKEEEEKRRNDNIFYYLILMYILFEFSISYLLFKIKYNQLFVILSLFYLYTI
jgi:hypothetical protein